MSGSLTALKSKQLRSNVWRPGSLRWRIVHQSPTGCFGIKIDPGPPPRPLPLTPSPSYTHLPSSASSLWPPFSITEWVFFFLDCSFSDVPGFRWYCIWIYWADHRTAFEEGKFASSHTPLWANASWNVRLMFILYELGYQQISNIPVVNVASVLGF